MWLTTKVNTTKKSFSLKMIIINDCIYICLDDANENKSHIDHIQAEPNGYPSGNGRIMGSPMHKNNRMNGIVPRMNITANPLSQDASNGEKVSVEYLWFCFFPACVFFRVAIRMLYFRFVQFD